MAKREDWITADVLSVLIDGVHHLVARPKLFSTGSRGWHASQKLEVGGERVQVSLSITVVGSKLEGKVGHDKRQDSQAKAKRPTGRKEAVVLSDGSELIQVD